MEYREHAHSACGRGRYCDFDGGFGRFRADGLSDRSGGYFERCALRLQSRISRASPIRQRSPITLNGKDYAQVFGKAAHVRRARGRQGPVRACSCATSRSRSPAPTTSGSPTARRPANLRWNVYDTGPRKAKNVILFIGDGMSLAHRVAARVLAKGIAEGKAFGKLAIDDMPHMALVATAGSDSIITDSANSASAYATGHKSAVNAMGVYADRTPDPLDDPKVETITSLVQAHGWTWRSASSPIPRSRTPPPPPWWRIPAGAPNTTASSSSSSRRSPTCIMGGGRANFLPKSAEGSKRKDEVRLRRRNFATPAIPWRSTGAEMTSLADDPKTTKLARAVHARQHGRRARSQVPQRRDRREVSATSRI